MEPLLLSLKLTLPLSGDVLLVRSTDGIRLIQEGRYQSLSAHEVGRWINMHNWRDLPELRRFVADARLAALDLCRLDDHAVLALVKSQLASSAFVLLRERQEGSALANSKTAELRRLVRAIEERSRRLSTEGRLYRLVADFDLEGVSDRNSYEVVPQAEGLRILEKLAEESSGDERLKTALLEASPKLSRDWRPPFGPDGLILLRKTIALAPSKPEEPAMTPSAMKKLVHKDWIEIEVVYDDGQPYRGPYRLTHPTGTEDEGRFPEDMWSKYEIDSGTFKLELPARAGTVADDELELDEDDEKTARRVRLGGMLFDANKSFLLPQALPGIKQIVATHDEDADAEVLIVGHAGGDEDLAGADIAFDRAQVLGAYLMNKPNVWLNWFGPDKNARSRWGTREIQLMLSVLPEEGPPFYQGNASGVTDAKTTAAIKAFQEHANEQDSAGLPTDGKADFATRKAIVEAYMDLEDTSFDECVVPIAHGCEGHFDDTPTPSGIVDDRRLEVFFFKDGIDPRPSERISPEGAPQYAAWLKLVVETKDFENHGIHVQIIDSQKQPAPFATVRLQGPTTAEATTDEHGFVSFFGLKAGEYTIRSEKNGYKIGVSKLKYPTAKTVPGFAKKVA